jgi:hypothetical protein
MTTVPSNLIPTRITQLPEYQGTSTLGYLPYVFDGVTYKVQFANIAAVGAVPSTRTITGGSGLTGGGDLSANRVISIAAGGVGFGQLADSGVAPGTYGDASNIPVLTVDEKGRVTIATTTPISLSNYVPTSRAILAGDGLTGGGTLAADRTISMILSTAQPQSGGTPVAGSATIAAREDHVHPAVDLSDTTETSGVLPMSRGGTGSSLSPVAGAILYSNGSDVSLSNPGSIDQVFFSGGTGSPNWRSVTGGTTGLTFGLSGSDYALSGTLSTASGGTGLTTTPGASQILIGTGTAYSLSTLTAGTGITITNAAGVLTIAATGGGAGTGTVTSVDASGGSTGLTFSGGPITSAGTLTLAGTLGTANGGTGQTTYSNGQLLIGTAAGSLAKSTLTAGTGISVTNASGSITVTNSAPDQTVSLTGAGTTSISGSYPNFTITSNDQFVGTVTSVAASGGTTGLTFSGSPITASGTLTLSGTLAVANGGTGATSTGAARTSLGAAASGANTDITSIALTSGTISTSPTGATDIVNKAYADSIASGINFHQSVRLSTVTALPAYTYNNGSSGVGATITANANGALSLDGVATVAGNRVLVKDEVGAAQAYHGIYVVTQVGNGSTPFILTRATDFDSAGTGVDQIDAGDFFLVTAGSTLSNTSWVQQTPLPITVGTTAIIFSQFGAPITYSAGTGLTLAGTVFSITNTGVSASTYGSASSVPVLAINAQGQVTSASTSSIAIAGSQITSGSVAIAQGGTGATDAGTARTNLGVAASGAITGSGLTMATARLLGRSSASTGAVEEITVGSGLTLSAGTLTATGGGTGTVTSVDGSGGTTGLTLTGGPITTSGTLTIGGTLGVANGGTGATTLTGVVIGNGTSAFTVKTNPSGAFVGATDTQTLTGKTLGNYTETVFAVTDGATVNLDPNNGPIQTWTLGANRTPGQASWAAGQSITLMVDDGSAFAITWTTLAVVWETDSGSAPTLATTGFTVIVLWKVGTTIYGARVGNA